MILVEKKIKVLRIITRLNIGGPSIHVSLLTKGLIQSDLNRFLSVEMLPISRVT